MRQLLSKEAQRFLEIGNSLKKESVSLSALARSLDVSPATLRKTFARIAEECDGDVVQVLNKGTHEMTLTDLGETVLQRLSDFSKPIDDAEFQTCFSLAVSQPMLSSGLLDELLGAMPTLPGGAFNLRATTQLQLHEILRGMRDNEIDLAIVSDIERQLNAVPEGVRVADVDSAVDVVVIAHDRTIIDIVNRAAHWCHPDQSNKGSDEAISSAMMELSRYRCATLPARIQVLSNLLPRPTVQAPTRRIEVDTVEAAVSFVRSGAADFAVVPAIYEQLELEQQEGRIIFSDPIGQIKVAVIAREGTSEEQTDRVRDSLSEVLEKNRSRAQWRRGTSPSEKFPRSRRFYCDLKYGYYIGEDASVANAQLQWCWESIRLFPDNSKDRRSLVGQIVNQFQAKFRVTHAEFRDTFFTAHVARVGRSSQLRRDFVARFHYCDHEHGVICGTWSGNCLHDRPGVFATVWSREKLDLTELTNITRLADLHSVMSAGVGCEDKSSQTDLARQLGEELCFEESGEVS